MDYTAIGIALAFISSLTTAAAHALLKAGKDKLAVQALIGAVGTVALALVCFFVPIPTNSLIPWLLATSALHTTYQLVLIRAYEASDFTVAYPIARGIAPISTVILGMALLGGQITTGTIVAVGLVSAGILKVAVGRTIAAGSLIAVGIAGLLTTTYTIVDAHAIRIAPSAMTFAAWFSGCSAANVNEWQKLGEQKWLANDRMWVIVAEGGRQLRPPRHAGGQSGFR